MGSVQVRQNNGELEIYSVFAQQWYPSPASGLGAGVHTKVAFADFDIQVTYRGTTGPGFAYGWLGAFDASNSSPATEAGLGNILDQFAGIHVTLDGPGFPIRLLFGDGSNSIPSPNGEVADDGDVFRVVGDVDQGTLDFYENGVLFYSKTGWTPVPSAWVAGLYSRPGGTVGEDRYRWFDDVFVTGKASGPVVYCTSKVSSIGCIPQMTFVGCPSALLPTSFDVMALDVINQRSGILFYGLAPASTPFQGGTLCVMPPVKRTPVQNSAGNPQPPYLDCTGWFSYDFNAYIRGGGDSQLEMGVTVYCQYWYRDPLTPSTTGLSNALRFTIGT
jgi:hypothetical protein